MFNRRFLVDQSTKTIIIANRITEHPKCPIKSDKFRVKDYWSNMVVRPYSEYNKPGIEFALTYFENSGVNIPSTVTSWVAMKAMPEYLSKLREATKQYETFCNSTGRKCICKFLYEDCDQVSLVRQAEEVKTVRKSKPISSSDKEFPPKQPPSNENIENSDKVPPNVCESVAPTNQSEYKSSYWKYLQPTYYFS